jgi:hypothetical protein
MMAGLIGLFVPALLNIEQNQGELAPEQSFSLVHEIPTAGE